MLASAAVGIVVIPALYVVFQSLRQRLALRKRGVVTTEDADAEELEAAAPVEPLLPQAEAPGSPSRSARGGS